MIPMGMAAFSFAVLAAWLLAMWLIKRVLIRRLKRWAERTPQRWDDALVESLSFPLDLLILASGVAVFSKALPLSSRADHLATVALQGAVIFSLVFFADRLVRNSFIKRVQAPGSRHFSQGVTQGLLRGFIIGLGVLAFLDLLGISITPILASLGIGSLAVALALQDTLSNFFSGIYLAVDRPVRVGDFVRLESGDEGTIHDIGWRSTRVLAPQGHMILVPNSKLSGSVIKNYSLPDDEVAVLAEVSVGYDSDLSRVERVTAEVAREVLKRTKGGVSHFDPLVRFHTFGDSGIQFTAVLRARHFESGAVVKHEFIKALTERYRQEGIVIPFPVRTIVRASAGKPFPPR